MKLKQVYSTTVHPKVPYNFDYSVENPSYYPTPTGDWEPGKLWFTMKWVSLKIGIKSENKGTVDEPAIKVTIYSTKSFDYKRLIDELAYRFEWNIDVSEFYRKFEKDKLLAPILKKFRGMHGFCGEDLYEHIMVTTFLQNANVKRTTQMTKAMLERYGTLLEFDGKRFWCFWTPEELVNVPEQEFRDLKVGYRAKTFLRVSKDFVEGKVNELEMRKMDLDSLKKDLLKIYGVGPASLMYTLNDVFHHKILSVIPPWEAKIYSKLLRLETRDPKKIMAFLDKRYGEYKAAAIGHLFMDISWKHKHEGVEWMEKLLPYA